MKKFLLVLLIAAAQGCVHLQDGTRTARHEETKQDESITTTEADYFVRIQGGTFTMGSPANEPERDDNEVQHQVTVSGFYMGKYEVTQKEWYEVMGTTVRQQRDKWDKTWFLKGEGDNYPMYNVSWYEAAEYCNKLSQKEGLTAAYGISGSGNNRTVTWNKNANGYRLPTEAEWEYACRAGTTTPFNTGNDITTSQANYYGDYPYNGSAKETYPAMTMPVGSFAANAWGLYDMHGNVWEWCWDWYGSYASGSQVDPAGAAAGEYRVLRGGSWDYGAVYSRSAYREINEPYNGFWSLGFRLVHPL